MAIHDATIAIDFDGTVDENPAQREWTDSPKVFADLYIDDSALGCPIKFEDGIKRPFVNWVKVRQRLVEEGFLD